MTVSGALADAWLLYRRLFRRSIVVAAVVYALIFGVEAARWSEYDLAFDLLSLALTIAGPLLLQGALIELVQDVHVGNRPAPIVELFRRTRPKILALVGASLLYGLLVVLGLLLLIVPGLYALARLSLIVPVIVLERLPVSAALDRSSAIVRGHSMRVLGVMLISTVLALTPDLIDWAVELDDLSAFGLYAGLTVLLAPYLAHLMSAVYYRLTDSESPLIHPALADGPLWHAGPRGSP